MEIVLGLSLYKLLKKTVHSVENGAGRFGGYLNLSFLHQELLRFKRPKKIPRQTNKTTRFFTVLSKAHGMIDAVGFWCALEKDLFAFVPEKGHELHLSEDINGKYTVLGG